MPNHTKRLGKGLEALLGDTSLPAEAAVPEGARIMDIEINRIDPNPNQPRAQFEEEALEELASSIAQHGIIQPIIVTQGKGGRYYLVAGERRWRAARMSGLRSIPAILREYDDQALMEVALIENLQRADLNPVEEAEAIRLLMDAYGLKQDTVAERVGKSRPAVANALRLLSLEAPILEMLRTGRISAGHARALLGIGDKQLRLETADQIIVSGLSVRQVERIASNTGKTRQPAKTQARDANIVSAEDDLRKSLGTKVAISGTARRGKITIEYYSRDDLNRIYAIVVGDRN